MKNTIEEIIAIWRDFPLPPDPYTTADPAKALPKVVAVMRVAHEDLKTLIAEIERLRRDAAARGN